MAPKQSGTTGAAPSKAEKQRRTNARVDRPHSWFTISLKGFEMETLAEFNARIDAQEAANKMEVDEEEDAGESDKKPVGIGLSLSNARAEKELPSPQKLFDELGDDEQINGGANATTVWQVVESRVEKWKRSCLLTIAQTLNGMEIVPGEPKKTLGWTWRASGEDAEGDDGEWAWTPMETGEKWTQQDHVECSVRLGRMKNAVKELEPAYVDWIAQYKSGYCDIVLKPNKETMAVLSLVQSKTKNATMRYMLPAFIKENKPKKEKAQKKLAAKVEKNKSLALGETAKDVLALQSTGNKRKAGEEGNEEGDKGKKSMKTAVASGAANAPAPAAASNSSAAAADPKGNKGIAKGGKAGGKGKKGKGKK